MSYWKKRLAIFLSVLIAFTTVFVITPTQQAEAASNVKFSWFDSSRTNYSDMPIYEVKTGVSNLFIGDLVCISSDNDSLLEILDFWNEILGTYLSGLNGATYKSSNSSVASVNSKTGKITAKKPGTTTITVKYKGNSTKCKLKVVKTLSLSADDIAGYPEEDKYASNFIKAYNGKITSSNRYKLLSILKKVGYFSIYGSESNYSTETTIIRTGLFYRAAAIADALGKYTGARNPLATKEAVCFNITSLSGSGKTIKATLENKVTADAIFSIKYQTDVVKKTENAAFPIYVVDTATRKIYTAIASVRQGSKTMTIKTNSLSLKKGRTYQLVDRYYRLTPDASSFLSTSKVSKFKAK